MTRRITLIRHAETEANAFGGWQGQTDSPVTERGRTQIDRSGQRFEAPDLLVSSDLERAVLTAEAIGAFEADARWREFDFGSWDSMRPDEIARRFPDQLAAMRAGEDFAPEGGERFSEFAFRVQAAFADVASRLDDDQHAMVVTHGGVIHALVSGTLGVTDRRALGLAANASATTVVLDGRPRVFTFSDATHLGDATSPRRGRSVFLYRHAETDANLERRWHGRTESSLTESGQVQAADLAASATALDHIASSPLRRARLTAEPVAAAQGREVEIVDGLVEMHFGDWEGMTSDEARDADPERFGRIFDSGIDEPRGATGETFVEAGRRFSDAVDTIAGAAPNGSIGLFTHGGVARAYIASLLGVAFADRHALPELRNTAHAEVVIEPARTRVASYNVAPHLDG